MSKYREQLIRLVKQDLPSLRSDFNQGANPLALHACCLRLFKMVELLIYEVLTSGSPEPQSVAPPAASPPSPSTPPVLAPQPSAGGLPDLPDLPPLDASAAPGNSVQINGMPPIEVVPGVMNVVVTPTGPAKVGPNGELEPIPPTA